MNLIPRYDITIILPVFNASKYIDESVNSILQQTFKNFTLLIINDGSTDNSGPILERMASKDSRIRLFQRENRGLIATLNEGLALCTTPLVARMDADDWAFPQRIEVQHTYMTAHPEVAVCGSGMVEYESGRLHNWHGYGEEVKIKLLFNCCIFHPTILARRDALLAVGGYATNMPGAEDYDLWARLAENGQQLAVLPNILLRYRIHPRQARSTYKAQMSRSTKKIQSRLFASLGITPRPCDFERHAYCASPCPETLRGLRHAHSWIQRLRDTNETKKTYDPLIFNRFLSDIQNSFILISFKNNWYQYLRRLFRNIFFNFIFKIGMTGDESLFFGAKHYFLKTTKFKK